MNDQIQKPYVMQKKDDASISIIDILLILSARSKTIVKTTAVFTVGSIVVCLLMSNVYTAKTTFIPPSNQQLSSQSAIAAQLGALTGGGGLAAALGKSPADIWVALLNSRTVAEYVVQRNNLMSVFHTNSLENAVERLKTQTKIATGKSGLISIEVNDHKPEFAAEIANSYMSGLLELNKSLVFSQAGQKRLFFEQQLKRARDGLAEAEILTESSLKSDDPNAASVKKILQASPRAISDTTQQLRARIAAKQIEISAMKSYAADGNRDLRRIQDELESLEEQLSSLEGVPTPKQVDIPEETREEDKQKAIQLAIDQKINARAKVQDIRFYDSLISLLTQQYEQARLDEAKEPVVFQVVDVATAPAIKSAPKRSLIVIISTVAGFFLSILWVFASNALSKANNNPENAEKIAQLKQDIPVNVWWQKIILKRLQSPFRKLKFLTDWLTQFKKTINRK